MENDKINVTITTSQIHDLREDGYTDAEIISAFLDSWNVSDIFKITIVGWCSGRLFDLSRKAFVKTSTNVRTDYKNAHRLAYGGLVDFLYWRDDANGTNELAEMQKSLADYVMALCSSEIQNAELYKR